MNEPRLCGRLLTRLFRNGQAGETTDIISLARGCGADVLEVLRAMAALERAGLADARRLRLTLSGLALAAAFSEPDSDASSGRERRPGRSQSAVSQSAVSQSAVSQSAVSQSAVSQSAVSQSAVSQSARAPRPRHAA